jgi:hypothetical protein
LLSKRELMPIQLAADVGLVSLMSTRLMKTVIPGKLFDYLAAGLPVISTTGGQTRAMLETTGAGWVCQSDNAGELVRLVETVAAMPANDRQALGAAGRAWVTRHMCATTMADNVAKLIESACAQPPPCRLARMARLTWAIVHACWSVATHRAGRAHRKLFSGDVDAEIKRCFSKWLTISAEGGCNATRLDFDYSSIVPGRGRHLDGR